MLGDAHKLPFRNNSLVLIVSTGTLHHLRNLKEFFKECERALKEKGEAWLYEFSHDVKPQELREAAKQWKNLRES
ncbi:MAG: hypothetical protein DRO23_02700 [Thermoprotei archaeon]|nr:MAG: hypothetical protein DRO23_02700 [Thermoprotei archaeon]